MQSPRPGESLLQKFGPDGGNLFEPAFRNGGMAAEEGEEEGDEEVVAGARHLHSQQSVISNWSQLSGMREGEEVVAAAEEVKDNAATEAAANEEFLPTSNGKERR